MKVTERGVTNAAIYYLKRYTSTEANLRRVLLRKIAHAQRDGDERELPEGALERVVANMVAAGYVDDAAFSRAWTQSLHRRGLPRRAIAARLRQKGVGPDDIEAALERLSAEVEDPDVEAARAYAQRRRFGRFRTKEVAPDELRDVRERELRSMARAGFAFQHARRVLDEEGEPAS